MAGQPDRGAGGGRTTAVAEPLVAGHHQHVALGHEARAAADHRLVAAPVPRIPAARLDETGRVLPGDRQRGAHEATIDQPAPDHDISHRLRVAQAEIGPRDRRGRPHPVQQHRNDPAPDSMLGEATETLTPASSRFTVITLARTPARRTWRKVTPEGWALAGTAQRVARASGPAMWLIRDSGACFFPWRQSTLPFQRGRGIR